MIKLNEEYSINSGQGTIVFTEGNKGTVNAEYEIQGNKGKGKINGTLENNILSGTFHVDSAVGLIEFTFTKNGFTAQWKTGLEPGPMRGKWEGIIENNSTSNNTQLSDEQKQYLEEGVTLEDFDEEYQGGDDGKVAWMKDKNFVLEALRQDPRILKHASAELKADRELVLEGIKQDINAIDYADEKLQSDPELLIARIILHFKGNENIVISDENFNAFLGHGESYDTLDLIENLLFKVEYIVLNNKKDEFENFDKNLFEFVNAHHECFWILQAVSVRLAKIERLAESSETNFTQEQYDNVSELANYFRKHLFTSFRGPVECKLDFAPSIEFETYFNDSEIDMNWEDCKWTSNADEEGLYFSEFIMEKTGMEWDKESWDDAKFYNHAISRIWVGLLNYSLRHINEGFDEENGAICLHSVVNEYYAPIQDSGFAAYGINTFSTITEYFLDIPKNDYDLNETDREDLEEYSGWQFDLRKVAHDMLERNLFDYWPGASEFAKRKMGK